VRKLLATLASLLVAAAAVAAPAGVTGLVGLLPGDSTAVVAVDVAALRAHPLVQSWLLEHSAPWSGVDEDAASFLSEAGLDPVRDVDVMLLAVRRGSHDDPLALFAGRYDPSSLRNALVKRGAVAVTIAGRSALRLEPQDHPRGDAEPPFMCIADDLLMVGSETALAAALTGGRGGSVLVAQSVADGHLDLAAPFWMAVDVPEQVTEAAGTREFHGDGADAQAVQGLVRATASVRRVAMYARVSDLLEMRSTAVATSEENAELLRDAVKGVIAAARLQVQERYPEAVDVLRAVKVQTDGPALSVSGTVPVALLQKLAEDAGNGTPDGR